MANPWDEFKRADEWEQFARVEDKPKPKPKERTVANMAAAGLDGFIQQTKDLLGGAVRGAGSIGATILSPQDAVQDAIERRLNPAYAGNRNDTRRADMTAGTQALGADPESLTYQGAKLGTEIAGTLGAGGAASKFVPATLPKLRQAVASSGFAVPGVGLGMRAAGGAIAGATAAGLINPDDALLGAAVGGALPPVVAAAGATGRAVGQAFRSKEAKAGSDLARALDLQSQQQIDAAIAQLQAARSLVPGSSPTVAQALRTPQAGIVERVVSDSKGGAKLKEVYAAQNAARQAALERAAAVNPLGAATARQELGDATASFAKGADKAARAKTSAAFEALPLDDASVYLPLDELTGVQGKYFGPGSIGGDEVRTALAKAREIGEVAIPATKPVTLPESAKPMTLAQAVRKAGGISLQRNDGLRGELVGLKGDLKNLVRTNGGRTPSEIAEMMHARGYLPDEDASTLFDALRRDANGRPQFSVQQDLERSYAAARDAGVDAAPAGVAPKTSTLREIQNLSSSIKSMQRAAAATPGKEREAAALGQMQEAIENKINQVIGGDGRFDEVLPLELVQNLEAARKLKADQVARFRTGPQADIFRKGADGQPMVEGQQVAAKFWRTPEDVRDFKRLIGDNEKLLGQFRSMVTTEGASTATAGGNLTSKFTKWVDNSLPKLRESFNDSEVKLIRRIAADIKRAEVAAAAGMSRGSNTYQNASNALDIGLLDSPAINALANQIPLVGRFSGAGLDWMRESARSAKARNLSNLLANPSEAANALQRLTAPGVPPNPLVAPYFYRAAPAIAADR